MPNKKTEKTSQKKTTKFSPSETIEKDQDDLMSTLESIKGLLEQSESKLNAARESISIANTNTLHDTKTLHHMKNKEEEEIVPILDQVIEPENSDSFMNIPELDSIFEAENTTNKFSPKKTSPEKSSPTKAPQAKSTSTLTTQNIETSVFKPLETEKKNQAKESLSSLTQKNLLIDALDNFQLDLELSLREDLMKTMVSLEKNLKEKISLKIEGIKKEILN